jgi:nucleoid-associated protein EbfC
MLKGLGARRHGQAHAPGAGDAEPRWPRSRPGSTTIEVEGEAGAGLVKAVASAKGELRRLSIDPSLFKPEEREVVEDLIVAAVKEATTRAQARRRRSSAR